MASMMLLEYNQLYKYLILFSFMTIKSDIDYVGGQPRIEGHRLWVSHIVGNIAEMGLTGYIEDFNLRGEEDKIKEAIDYCRFKSCVGHVVNYCQGCNKSAKYPGENVWELAQKVYDNNFKAVR